MQSLGPFIWPMHLEHLERAYIHLPSQHLRKYKFIPSGLLVMDGSILEQVLYIFFLNFVRYIIRDGEMEDAGIRFLPPIPSGELVEGRASVEYK